MTRRQSRKKTADRYYWAKFRTRWWLGGGGLLIAIAAALAWYTWRRVPDIPVPELDLRAASVPVAQAVTTVRNRVVAAPRSAVAWGELGMVLFAHQFEQEANICLGHARDLDPSEFRWPYLLGISLSVSDPEEAANNFRRAIFLRADSAIAHLRLGELLLSQSRFDQAAQHLHASRQHNASDPRVHFDLAQLFFSQGDLAAALSSAQQAARLAPHVQSVHELLATIQQRLGNREAALAELQRVEESTVPSLEWHDAYAAEVLALRRDAIWSLDQAESLLARQQAPAAIRLLYDTLARDDRDPRVYVLLARALMANNQLMEAEQLLVRAAQRHPRSSEIHLQRGVVQFIGERYSEAEASFRLAVELEPDFATAHYNLGHALMKLKKPAEALEAFQTTATLRPNYASAHTNVGRLWLEGGENAKALVPLRRALQLNPNDDEARRLLEKASNGG